MIDIPKQLRIPEARFVLLGKWDEYLNRKTKEKKTFYPSTREELQQLRDDGWTPLGKTAFEDTADPKHQYAWNDEKLQNHKGNIGLISFTKRDIDDPVEGQKIIDGKRVDTFCQKSSDGRLHLIYNCEGIKNSKDAYGEVRAKNYYIVISPSKHPLGHKYEIINDLPIQTISQEQFIAKWVTPYANKTAIVVTGEDANLTEELNEKLKSNQSIQKYLEGDIQNRNSRSEAEMSLVCQLIQTGLNRAQVYNVMSKCKIGKWQESPIQYRNKTYEKAISIITKERFSESLEEINASDRDEIEKLRLMVELASADVIRRDIETYLKKIIDINLEQFTSYFLSAIAYKTKIKSKVLESLLLKIKSGAELVNPLLSAEEILSMSFPQTEYYIDKLIPKNAQIRIVGKPGKSKTLMVLAMVLAMTAGQKFVDRFLVTRSPKVLYYNLDKNSNSVIYSRLKYLINGTKYNPDICKRLFFRTSFDVRNLDKELEFIKTNGAEVIVFDSYTRMLLGDENKTESTQALFSGFFSKLRDMNVTSIIIDHGKKGNDEDGDIIDFARGAGDKTSQDDYGFKITKTDDVVNIDNRTREFNVEFEASKDRSGDIIRIFNIHVVKDDEKGETRLTFNGFKPMAKRTELNELIIKTITAAGTIKYKDLYPKLIEIIPNLNRKTLHRALTEMTEEEILSCPVGGTYTIYKDMSANNASDVVKKHMQEFLK